MITGTVTDVDGLPAQGIAVTALARRYVGPQGEAALCRRRMPRPRCRTIAASIASIGLPAGDYIVAAQPQGRQAGPATEVRTLSRGVVSDRSRS